MKKLRTKMKNIIETQEYVEQVNEMVPYQEDVIISKVLTDKETGRITMYSFDKGQGVSEQSLPFDSLLFITDGNVEVVLNSDDISTLSKDQVIYIPKNTPHELYGVEAFKMLSITIGSNND